MDTGANVITIVKPSGFNKIPASELPPSTKWRKSMLLAHGSSLSFPGRGRVRIRLGEEQVLHDVWKEKSCKGVGELLHRCQSRSESLVPVRQIDPCVEVSLGITEGQERFTRSQLLVPKALVDLTNDIVPLRLFNPTDQPQTVCRDTIASLCEPVEDVSVDSRKGVDRSGTPAGRACRVTPSTTPLPAYLDDLHQRSTSCLEEAQKAEVAALLAEFAHAFSSSADDLGSTSIVKHEIQTNKS